MQGRGKRLAAAATGLAVSLAVALGPGASAGGQALAGEQDCVAPLPGQLPNPDPGGRKLRFGIYPGGTAGQVGPPAPATPDDPEKTLAALKDLRGGQRPFVTHLYLNYRNPEQAKQVLDDLEIEGRRYARAGFKLEYVITYRPEREGGDVPGFLAYVRKVVRRLAPVGRFKELQVTNEANQTATPDSSDGAFAGARDALVQGLPAAKHELRRLGRGDVEVGFNWFYRTDPANETEFWDYIDNQGGERFQRALDWVGLDAYPGTFFPPTTSDYRSSMVTAFIVLRRCYMPMGDISGDVPIHVTENGYPTDLAARTEANQATALEQMVQATHDYRAKYNISDYRWFDLRDADSESPSFGQHYGLLHDDYTPKPAFAVYRDLIDELSR